MRIATYPERYSSTGWAGSIARPALLVALGALAVYLVGLALQLQALLAFPYPIQYEDGPILNGGQMLLQGEDPYKDNSAPPYAASVYAPLYYVAIALTQLVAGTGMAGPRALSLVSTLLVAAVIYRWVSWRTASRPAALIASGALLTFFPVANWMASTRVDILAVLFSVTAVYIVDRHARGHALWLAVPLMALAFFTKQTQLAAPVAAALYLLSVSPGRAFRFGFAYVAAVGVPFIALDLATGHRLYHHIVDYSSSQSTWIWRAKQLLKSFLTSYWAYFWIATAGTIESLRRVQLPISTIYLALAASTAFISTTSAGSDFNHYIELCAALSTVVGISLGRVLTADAPRLRQVLLVLIAVQLCMRVPSVAPGVSVPWLPASLDGRGAGVSEPPLWLDHPTTGAKAAGDRLMAEVSVTDGPVLLEQSAFAALAGRRPLMDDPFIFVSAAKSGQWDQGPLLADLRSGEVGLVALHIDVRPANVHHTRLTDEMIAAIREDYRLVETIPYPLMEGPFLYLYRPVPRR